MPLKFFVVPALDPANAEEDVNAFLASRRVVHVERCLVEAGPGSFWTLCVEWTSESAKGSRTQSG